MEEIARTVSDGLIRRGWSVRQIETSPLSGRLIAADPHTGEECEVDILKEAFWSPPAMTDHGPVLALDDVIGTAVRALAERGAVRDLIDVHAASHHRTTADLETLTAGNTTDGRPRRPVLAVQPRVASSTPGSSGALISAVFWRPVRQSTPVIVQPPPRAGVTNWRGPGNAAANGLRRTA